MDSMSISFPTADDQLHIKLFLFVQVVLFFLYFNEIYGPGSGLSFFADDSMDLSSFNLHSELQKEVRFGK